MKVDILTPNVTVRGNVLKVNIRRQLPMISVEWRIDCDWLMLKARTEWHNWTELNWTDMV